MNESDSLCPPGAELLTAILAITAYVCFPDNYSFSAENL